MTKADLIEAVAKAAKISQAHGGRGRGRDLRWDRQSDQRRTNDFRFPASAPLPCARARRAKAEIRRPATVISIKASRTVGFKAAPVLKKGL